VLAAREGGLAGATVFRGFMGYAPHAEVAAAGILRLAENLPVVVDIVDEEGRIEGFLPFLRRAVGTGLVISSKVEAEQILPGADASVGGMPGAESVRASTAVAVRTRVYFRDSATFEGRPAHALILAAFADAGMEDVSAHHGILGFDRASGVLSAHPLRFHTDLPVVVEAVGGRGEAEAALPRVREVLDRGLITLAPVKLHAPEPPF